MQEITIKIRPIDPEAPGSFLKHRAAKSIGARLIDPSDLTAHDDMIRFIMDNADIEAPEDANVYEVLLNYSINAIRDMFRKIMGGEDIPNMNGA